MFKKFLIFLIIIGGAYMSYHFYSAKKIQARALNEEQKNHLMAEATSTPPEKTDRIAKFEIGEGTTFAQVMTDKASTTYGVAMEIYNAALPVYDLTKVKQGKIIELVYDKDSDELKELRYKVDSEDELFVRQTSLASSSAIWKEEKKPIPYEIRERVAKGTVKTSMYQAAIDDNIDIKAIIELANVFQWTIDFAMDPRVGDTFEFVYEERYLDGEYVMPGRIFAGKYVNAGTEVAMYYFEESESNKAYFDEKGNAAQKMFLKAPVEFRYISSGFTTGKRYVEAFNVSTGHRAIDYAASAGTPIRAVGDGVVTHASWSTAGYGNLTSIRHNGTYSTNYGHQSRFAVKAGERVKQGQIIGYVGSTGFSTGPHLHYEMVKNGTKINPLLEVQPPGEPIKAENKQRFLDLQKLYNDKMAK